MDGAAREYNMVYETILDKNKNPCLKKVDRPYLRSEGRGVWVEIGRVDHIGIERLVTINRNMGHLVLPDEDGFYRALVLTD